ncbi:MAG: riboflavin biosynthesis protein RibF [Gemmatimonadales bacterium]|nr:riboflavin biosynthesis protein RibF [Gemmatimonadales bacterium]
MNDAGAVVTLGSFDGVHVGHRAVLDEIARRAQATGRRSVLVTFEPHPAEVLRPARAPRLLAPGLERVAALAESAVERVHVLRFDAAMAALPPERFVTDVLRPATGCTELVVGHDHAFGRGRAGDVALLRALGAGLGFVVDEVPPVLLEGAPVSSSRIRQAVAGGDLAEAARWLGRPYAVDGVVERGAGRGRQLGVPTINVGGIDPRKALPPDGVWAAWVEWPGGRHGAMLNQGPRPTFDDGRPALEAHLFGVSADLYGAPVRVTWVTRLRATRRFPSVEALQAQLQDDRRAAEAALARAG